MATPSKPAPQHTPTGLEYNGGSLNLLFGQRRNLWRPRHWNLLRAIHADLENAAAAGDINSFFEANQAFHLTLHEIADNRWLLHVIEDLRKVIKLSRHHSLFSDGRLAQSLTEHRDILQALLARDGSRAEELMRAHILSGRAALARIAATRSTTTA